MFHILMLCFSVLFAVVVCPSRHDKRQSRLCVFICVCGPQQIVATTTPPLCLEYYFLLLCKSAQPHSSELFLIATLELLRFGGGRRHCALCFAKLFRNSSLLFLRTRGHAGHDESIAFAKGETGVRLPLSRNYIDGLQQHPNRRLVRRLSKYDELNV